MADLTLTSLVIGPRIKAAGICGKMYREGEWIVVPGNSSSVTSRLQVTKIDSRSVEISVNDQTYVLTISKPQLVNTDQIVPHIH